MEADVCKVEGGGICFLLDVWGKSRLLARGLRTLISKVPNVAGGYVKRRANGFPSGPGITCEQRDRSGQEADDLEEGALDAIGCPARRGGRMR